MDRDDLGHLARFVLVLYVLGALYVLFTPSPPATPGRLELIGHFGLFFVLGVLVALALPGISVVWRSRVVVLSGLVLGAATELVQGQLPARAFEYHDLAADWAGTMVASVVPFELVLRGPGSGTEQ